jgi:phage shock protein A
MGIFDRLGTILRANINDMLNKAEDPEKTLDLLLRDMQSAISEARGQVAQMIAQQRSIEADVQRGQALVDEWDARARQAINQGRDDLARDALRRKADYTKNLDLYKQQLDSQRQLTDKLKSELGDLEFKYNDALRKRDELIARQRRAKTQQEIQTKAQKFDTMDPLSQLSQLEGRVRREEAQVEATEEASRSTLESQFEELERSSEIDDMLEQMKREEGGQKKPGGGSSSGPAAYPS